MEIHRFYIQDPLPSSAGSTAGLLDDICQGIYFVQQPQFAMRFLRILSVGGVEEYTPIEEIAVKISHE